MSKFYSPDTGFGEFISFDGPPKPPKKIRADTGRHLGKRKRLSERKYHIRRPDKVPGQSSWASLREQRRVQFRNQPGFKSWSRSGIPDGLTKKEAALAWQNARRLALQDMKLDKEVLWTRLNEMMTKLS